MSLGLCDTLLGWLSFFLLDHSLASSLVEGTSSSHEWASKSCPSCLPISLLTPCLCRLVTSFDILADSQINSFDSDALLSSRPKQRTPFHTHALSHGHVPNAAPDLQPPGSFSCCPHFRAKPTCLVLPEPAARRHPSLNCFSPKCTLSGKALV